MRREHEKPFGWILSCCLDPRICIKIVCNVVIARDHMRRWDLCQQADVSFLRAEIDFCFISAKLNGLMVNLNVLVHFLDASNHLRNSAIINVAYGTPIEGDQLIGPAVSSHK